MLENDIYDDDDMVNPFNAIYELNNDMDVELDEEKCTKQGWYRCSVGWGM